MRSLIPASVLLGAAICLVPFAISHEGGGGGGAGKAGPGLAVTQYTADDGFKMSPDSIKTLGVEFTKLPAGPRWTMPSSAIVRAKHVTGAYRRISDGWITMVLVKVIETRGSSSIIESQDLEAGDEVATQGVQFLRVTDVGLAAGGGGEEE